MDLLTLTREGLRMAVRSAVRRAIAESETVTLRARFKIGESKAVLVTAAPVQEGTSGDLILLSFAKVEDGDLPSPSRDAEFIDVSDGNLEGELRSAREEMRATVEQYEAANEELTAANEEVTSINEELQATNEELESSKEELQSLNEELITVNAQLDSKNVELAEASDDLRNLMEGRRL